MGVGKKMKAGIRVLRQGGVSLARQDERHLKENQTVSTVRARRSPICAGQHVPPHEEMSIVVYETLVMHVMVPGCAQPKPSECRVPGMCRLAARHMWCQWTSSELHSGKKK